MSLEKTKNAVEESIARISALNTAHGGKMFSESDLKSFEEKFSEWVTQDHVSGEALKDIVSHWFTNGATESLDLIKVCMMNTYGIDAKEILQAVYYGSISEADAVCISKAERNIIDFVDQDYEEHIEEYEGYLPIAEDDWDYITGVLIDKAQKGMAGEAILAAINQWIEKGAYRFCSFEDALEGGFAPSSEMDKAPLSDQIQSAFSRITNHSSSDHMSEKEVNKQNRER